MINITINDFIVPIDSVSLLYIFKTSVANILNLLTENIIIIDIISSVFIDRMLITDIDNEKGIKIIFVIVSDDNSTSLQNNVINKSSNIVTSLTTNLVTNNINNIRVGTLSTPIVLPVYTYSDIQSELVNTQNKLYMLKNKTDMSSYDNNATHDNNYILQIIEDNILPSSSIAALLFGLMYYHKRKKTAHNIISDTWKDVDIDKSKQHIVMNNKDKKYVVFTRTI